MDERTRTLAAGLGWMLPVGLGVRLATAVGTLLAARWIGPEAFGLAALALAAAAWVQIPLLFGLPFALAHHLPRRPAGERPAWIRTALLMFCGLGAGTLAVTWAGRALWERLFGIPEAAVGLALLWCAGFVPFAAAGSILAGSERFRDRAAMEGAFGAAYVLLLLVLWRLGRLDAPTYVGALSLAYAVAGLGALRACAPPSGGAAASAAAALARYGRWGALGSLSTALLQAFALPVAFHHIPPAEVGLLAVYQAGAVQTGQQIVVLAWPVLLPVASRADDRRVLVRKIVRAFLPLGGVFAVVLFAGLAISFALLGEGYPFDPATALLFSAAASLGVFHGLLGLSLASGGERGARSAVAAGVVAGLVNAAGAWWAVPAWGVRGAAVAACAGYAAGALAAWRAPLPPDGAAA